jgi:hypothetical protein
VLIILIQKKRIDINFFINNNVDSTLNQRISTTNASSASTNFISIFASPHAYVATWPPRRFTMHDACHCNALCCRRCCASWRAANDSAWRVTWCAPRRPVPARRCATRFPCWTTCCDTSRTPAPARHHRHAEQRPRRASRHARCALLLLGDSSVRIVALVRRREAQCAARSAPLVVDAHVLVTTPTRWLDYIDGARRRSCARRCRCHASSSSSSTRPTSSSPTRPLCTATPPRSRCRPPTTTSARGRALFTCRWLFSATLTRDETELEHIFALRHAFVYCRAEMALPDSLAFEHLVVASPAHRLSASSSAFSPSTPTSASSSLPTASTRASTSTTSSPARSTAPTKSRSTPRASRFRVARAALHNFRVLVCTDAAARGLDIAGLPLVIHYEHPPLRADVCPPLRSHGARRRARQGDFAAVHRIRFTFGSNGPERAAKLATSRQA